MPRRPHGPSPHRDVPSRHPLVSMESHHRLAPHQAVKAQLKACSADRRSQRGLGWPPMDDSPRYCDHCGEPPAPGQQRAHDACRAARALDPPRYCPRCGRRMVVKVTPTTWSAHCPHHDPTHNPS
ncbi:MAG: biotin synthase auxiliary protein BsaP [Streptosporangiaceae bacterium]